MEDGKEAHSTRRRLCLRARGCASKLSTVIVSEWALLYRPVEPIFEVAGNVTGSGADNARKERRG
jgi:hypothetical protein